MSRGPTPSKNLLRSSSVLARSSSSLKQEAPSMTSSISWLLTSKRAISSLTVATLTTRIPSAVSRSLKPKGSFSSGLVSQVARTAPVTAPHLCPVVPLLPGLPSRRFSRRLLPRFRVTLVLTGWVSPALATT